MSTNNGNQAQKDRHPVISSTHGVWKHGGSQWQREERAMTHPLIPRYQVTIDRNKTFWWPLCCWQTACPCLLSAGTNGVHHRHPAVSLNRSGFYAFVPTKINLIRQATSLNIFQGSLLTHKATCHCFSWLPNIPLCQSFTAGQLCCFRSFAVAQSVLVIFMHKRENLTKSVRIPHSSLF